jgi:hypothetical protein
MQFLKRILTFSAGLALGFAIAVLMLDFLTSKLDRKEPVHRPTLSESLKARPIPVPRKAVDEHVSK